MLRSDLMKEIAVEHLEAYAKDEQERADYLQSLAIRTQRSADRARKEIRRREREAKKDKPTDMEKKNE